MFNPREPRDTGGKWVRMGRGELEQMIDALAHPRAAHIAEVNGKPNSNHVNVVRRDIKARVLKGVKVAPTYHVKVEGDGARRRVMIQAKGQDGYARAIIPERKSQGNVDVTQFRRGGPDSAEVVGAAGFDVQPNYSQRTDAVREKMRAALGIGQRTDVGVTGVAKKVAAKKRKRAIPAMTDEVGVKAMHRQVEAAVAAKGIKKAQGDRVKALITRYEPKAAVFGEAADFWEGFPAFIKRAKLRDRGNGIGKADVEAVDAIAEWFAQAGTVGAGMKVKGAGPAGDAALLKHLPEGADPGVKAKLAKMLAENPAKPGEAAYDRMQRIRRGNRDKLAADPPLLAAVRIVRREGKAGGGGGIGRQPAAAPRPRMGDKFGLSNKTLPGGTGWLMQDIGGQQNIGGGVNATWRGTIDGRTVFFKPQSGAYDREIHAGIPSGNDAGRERAAYLVGQAMGMDNLAPVVIRDVPGHGKCIVQGGVGRGTGLNLGTPRGPQAERDKRSIALFDMVIGNMDRHAKNYTVDPNKGRIYPIDNGLAFAQGDNDRGGWNLGFMTDFFGSSLTMDERATLEQMLVNNDLWNGLRDAGLPAEAVTRAQRRVKYMIRNGKFLRNATQLGGNSNRLDNIA